jgi:uncharacterized membrane protein YqgA involved in biofilm formation
MTRVLVCFGLLALAIVLASLVGLAFAGDDQSQAESLVRQVIVLATLAIGLAVTDRTATAGSDFARCLLAWLLFALANAFFVVAVLLLISEDVDVPEWISSVSESSFRSVGWFPGGPDADLVTVVVLWILSGVVVIGLAARGASLIRRHFLA